MGGAEKLKLVRARADMQFGSPGCVGAGAKRADPDLDTAERCCGGLLGDFDGQLVLWKTAHLAQPRPIDIKGDTSVALTMAHVPEEHPDARWVR